MRGDRYFVTSLALGIACSQPSASPAMRGTDSGPSATESTSSSEPPSQTAADACEGSPVVDGGRFSGTLALESISLGGGCGRGGPDAFVRVHAPFPADVRLLARAYDYEPLVGVVRSCFDGWSDALLCTQGVAGWVTDIERGGEVAISIGITDEDARRLASLATPEYDPFAFTLEVDLRPILAEGEPCSPPERGRCAAGLICGSLGSEDGSGGGDVLRCTSVPGDTCWSANAVSLALGTTVLQIEPMATHTDAHESSCGPERSRERVYRVDVVDGATTVIVSTEGADVGLAARGASCLPADELGCRPPGDSSALAVDAVASEPVFFLFVELGAIPFDGTETGDDSGSATEGEEPPIELTFEVI